mmetsp:Transcript_45814/g.141600  ORF Transcript_45814/g.141600 Transcript_45814/m.141600 type:complete len:110 (+) Transcript_45814:1-330(+)
MHSDGRSCGGARGQNALGHKTALRTAQRCPEAHQSLWTKELLDFGVMLLKELLARVEFMDEPSVSSLLDVPVGVSVLCVPFHHRAIEVSGPVSFTSFRGVMSGLRTWYR